MNAAADAEAASPLACEAAVNEVVIVPLTRKYPKLNPWHLNTQARQDADGANTAGRRPIQIHTHSSGSTRHRHLPAVSTGGVGVPQLQGDRPILQAGLVQQFTLRTAEQTGHASPPAGSDPPKPSTGVRAGPGRYLSVAGDVTGAGSATIAARISTSICCIRFVRVVESRSAARRIADLRQAGSLSRCRFSDCSNWSLCFGVITVILAAVTIYYQDGNKLKPRGT